MIYICVYAMLNGRCSGDKDGKFTYVGSKGSSVVDYVITSQNMLSCVYHFDVNSPNILQVFYLLYEGPLPNVKQA